MTESPKQQSDSGCYDLIGDVHGYLDLLDSLAEQLGYSKKGKSYEHPEGRKLIFVGDLINRGPDSIGVLKTVRETWEEGNAFLVLGNHEFKVLQLAAMKKPLPNPGYESFLPWLKSLPLFLDLEEIRVIHAAWHSSSVS
ncbi:MAG: metallophosphoesterase, partial [Opitutae bacterium]